MRVSCAASLSTCRCQGHLTVRWCAWRCTGGERRAGRRRRQRRRAGGQKGGRCQRRNGGEVLRGHLGSIHGSLLPVTWRVRTPVRYHQTMLAQFLVLNRLVQPRPHSPSSPELMVDIEGHLPAKLAYVAGAVATAASYRAMNPTADYAVVMAGGRRRRGHRGFTR
jgi:hypothetical protein